MVVEIKGMRYLNERKKNKTVRKVLLIVLSVFVLAVVVLGIAGYRFVTNSLEPMDEASEEVVEVEIPRGSNRRNIANILEENDLINHSLIFDYYVRLQGDNNFQAGTYLMSPSMSVEEMVEYLNAGGTPISEQALAYITVPEGIHLEQIADQVEASSDFSAQDFMKRVQDEAFIEELATQYPDLLTDSLEAAEETRYILEGYLYPATYEVFEENSLDDVIIKMVGRMNQAMQPYYEDIQASDLTVHEILTLSSYIEREGTTDEDRQLISGVFYNRIDVGMPLQTDPSVSYALGEHRERTTYADLEVDSPYNTYMYNGIGAGPIASPSESAIHASVNPTETDYYYFLADLTTGDIYFAEDYEQHLEYQNEYLRNND